MAFQIKNKSCRMPNHALPGKPAPTEIHWHCEGVKGCVERHADASSARWCEFRAVLSRPDDLGAKAINE